MTTDEAMQRLAERPAAGRGSRARKLDAGAVAGAVSCGMLPAPLLSSRRSLIDV
jgi:hypothetical protein